MDPQDLLIVGVLTTAGTVSFAPLLTGFIAVLKGLNVPGISGNEPRVATILGGIIVVLALVQVTSDGTMPLSIQTLYVGFTSWYALTRLAMGIHDDVSGSPRSLAVGLTAALSIPAIVTLAILAGIL
jgi:hypothetical protein